MWLNCKPLPDLCSIACLKTTLIKACCTIQITMPPRITPVERSQSGLTRNMESAGMGGAEQPADAHVTWINRFLRHLPPNARGHIVAALGEFAGTIFFLFFAFAGTQVANISSNTNTGTTIVTTVVSKNPAQLLYISLSFGFSLAVNAWVFFRISGGLFNPAVTFGMLLIGSISIFRAVLLVFVQILGAIAAAGLVDVLFSGGLNVSTELATTTSIAQGFFIEMILTAQLVFAIFMLAAEKHAGTFIAPVGIGLALFICELTGKIPAPHFNYCAKRLYRRILDRRVTQSCSVLWPRRRSPQLRWLSLDILACTTHWSWTGSCSVQAN